MIHEPCQSSCPSGQFSRIISAQRVRFLYQLTSQTQCSEHDSSPLHHHLICSCSTIPSKVCRHNTGTAIFYMFSNWSTLLLVLPFLTSLRVLYLSRPCFTFSLWIRSIVVSPVSSLMRLISHSLVGLKTKDNNMTLVGFENGIKSSTNCYTVIIGYDDCWA